MTTYTTVQGDMWDAIAYKLLGSTRFTGDLYAANLDLCHYFTFPAGIVLNIPEVVKPVVSNELPPWKR